MEVNIDNREAVHLAHASEGSDGSPVPDYFVHLTFEFEIEDGVWCGHCVELGTAAFADTKEQTRLELLDATLLQLEGVEQLDELEAYLAKNAVPLYMINAEALRQARFAEMVPA